MGLPSGEPLREFTAWERLRRWGALGVLGAGACGLVLVGGSDAAGNLRGYTGGGLALGVIGTVLCMLAAAYSARKRRFQEPASSPVPEALRGSVAAWLNAHVVLGTLALLAAAMHGGFGLFAMAPTWGRFAFWTLALLVVSGVIWRVRYARLPRKAMAEDLRSWSEDDAEEWVKRRSFQMRQLAAGGSDALQTFCELLLTEPPQVDAAALVAARLTGADRKLAERIRERAERVAAWRKRAPRIAEYRRRLRTQRLLHVPATLALVLAVPVHVLMAFELPQRVAPAWFGGFAPPEDCASCHARIVEEWQGSMHAHALSSPVTVVQNNQVVTGDNLRSAAVTTRPVHPSVGSPTKACVNCHGPVGVRLTGAELLPFEEPVLGGPVHGGVDCAACHQQKAAPASGFGAADAFIRGLRPGRLFFGGIADPIGNAYHRTEQSAAFQDPDSLCQSCHNVVLDLNGDGRPDEKGTDLVLQTLWDEGDDLTTVDPNLPGCVDCHMGGLSGETGRAAESASIPFEQDFDSPAARARSLSDHSFVGVDYPLDELRSDDPHEDKRVALLRQAGSLKLQDAEIDGGRLAFTAVIRPGFVGHNLPSGFAFARQLWIEVVVLGEAGDVLADSGAISLPSEDLCDSASLAEASIRPHMTACDGPDRQLVNLQAQLVDKVRARRDQGGAIVRDATGQAVLEKHPDGEEVVTQWLEGGAAARTRPADGQALTPIPPGSEGSYGYVFRLDDMARPPRSGERLRVKARLRFRNLPPYFVRKLDAEAANHPGEPDLGALVDNLRVYEVSEAEADVFAPRRQGLPW